LHFTDGELAGLKLIGFAMARGPASGVRVAARRVLARGLVGHTADEHVEVVANVEFFEKAAQQLSRQHKAVRTFGQGTKVIEVSLDVMARF
jgi:hypothetical protein